MVWFQGTSPAVRCNCWRQLRQECSHFARVRNLRKYPHTKPVICCYFLSFVCGYQEYGTQCLLKAALEAVPPAAGGAVSIQWSYPLSQWLLGLPYILFSLPVGYVLGQLIGHKWTMFVGQGIMYAHGLASVIVCVDNVDCLVQWYFPLLAVPFMIGFVTMNVSFIQLALEQVENVHSAAKSSFINWLWFYYFLGRGCTVFVTSFILFWAYPTHAYVIKVGLAVMALSLLLWMPFERGSRGPVLAPWTSIYEVCKEAFGKCQCQCRRLGQVRERVVPQIMNFNQNEFPMDHHPNAFQRASTLYGGPLPLETVRDVQETVLVVFMLCSFVGINIIYSIIYSAYAKEVSKMDLPNSLLNAQRSHVCLGKGIEYNQPNFPVGWVSVAADFTTVVAMALLNSLVFTKYAHRISIHTRIVAGTVAGFLASLSSVVTESIRYKLTSDKVVTGIQYNGFVGAKNLPAAVSLAAQGMSLFYCVPQYVLCGVMTALIIPATSELAGLSTPVKYRPLMFGVYFTVMGLSMVTGGLIMLVQMKPDSLWCFFCSGTGPTTGLVTFIITSLLTISLFLLYLILSWLFEKANRVIQPARSEIDTTMFGRGNHDFSAPHLEQNGSHDSN